MDRLADHSPAPVVPWGLSWWLSIMVWICHVSVVPTVELSVMGWFSLQTLKQVLLSIKRYTATRGYLSR